MLLAGLLFRNMSVKLQEIAELITDKNDPENVFQLLDILGQGSYGSVSKALHKETGQLYAIKILPATSGMEIASIKKQITVLKECDDDHIVRYYSTFFKDNHLWIVMEYCVGGSITDIMQITKKRLNEYEIASILESALKGLSYIHMRKKIHRDIKAANILLDTRGFAKLADFGVSASAMYTNARFRTHIGSPYWMSPEILKYSQYDHKTDIWSLGITAIQLAEGQVPNSHIKPFMVIFMTKSNPVQGFKEPSLWSAEFNDFVKKCLQVNPYNRPEASELLSHPFIKMYSKGERLLSQLVLSCLEEIEEFRMNQSRNSSFAEIIIDEGKDTKTIVQKNESHNASLKDSEPAVEGSMIIHSHDRDISAVGSVVVNDNSMVINQDDDADNNVLKNYINQLKSIDSAHLKCVDMLQKTINAYDEKCQTEIERVLKDYQSRAKNDIEYLRQMKAKENPEGTNHKTLTFEELGISCRLIQCKDLEEFLFPDHKFASEKDDIDVVIAPSDHGYSKVLTEESENLKFYKEPQIKHNQSLAERQTQSTLFMFQRKETKSFLQAQLQQKKPIERQRKTNPNILQKVDDQGNDLEQGIFYKPASHKSSRVVIKVHDTPVSLSKKIQQFRDDPDVLEYLKKTFTQSTQSHSKSGFQTKHLGNKVYTEMSVQPKSNDHSVSRGKNKSAKNLKSKKPKSRMAS